MSKITKVFPLPANPPKYPEAKVLVYIDGQKCITIRERTWQAMDLKEGDTITCDELKQRENFHWKNAYGKKDADGKNAWNREKVRLGKVRSLIEGISPDIVVNIVGFGADSVEMIPEHPEKSGQPDIELCLRDTGDVLALVEVSGTEVMRGVSYWVRPDKLKYIENHPDQDIWIILHYAKPTEKFVFIKPLPGKTYATVSKVINGSNEIYVEFWDKDDEVVEFDEFKRHLIEKIPS